MKSADYTRTAKRNVTSPGLICIALLILLPVRGTTLRAPALSGPVQNKVTVVGILPFQDETDTGAPPELGRKIAQQLKQRLSVSFKDVLPKSLVLNSDAASTAALTVEQVVALGKQNAVQLVVRGGLLALGPDQQSNITAQLYAEIISVESGAVSVVRAEGTAAGGGIQWSRIDLNSASFSSSGPGTALAAAIESLAVSIHQAMLTPLVEVAPVANSVSGAGTIEPTPPVDAAAADADEELQQLIAQAEEVVGSGAGDTDQLKSVSAALQKLKAVLTSKASLIEGGADPTESDQEIAAARTEMQAALTALTEHSAPVAANSEEVTPPTGEKKNLLGTIDQRATEVLGILQKIQEMRAAVRGAKEDPYVGDAGPEGPPLEASEQPTEDVSGVVMQSGQPLAGVEVTDTDSDATAITAPDGSYTLKALPAGKLSTLILKKDGKQLASGQIDMLRGRTAVADFDVTPKMSPKASALRIIPSTRVLNSKAKATGTLKGIAKDKTGKPLPRALVILPTLGVVRTDSSGHYAFFKVPAGEHVITIQKAGLKPVSTRVTVTPNGATEAQSQLATALPKDVRVRQRAIVPGTGSNLHGRVLDTDGNPIAGAKVLLLQSNSATSVRTSRSGDYELKDLKAGTYTVVATQVGYANRKLKVTVTLGKAESLDFQLKRQASPYVAKALNAQTLGRPSRESVRRSAVAVRSPTVPERSAAVALRPVSPSAGELTGRVVDAATRRPIVGATVSIRGRSVKTTEVGSFSLNNLAPGNYQINVARAGFSEEQRSVAIRAGASSREDFALKRPAIGNIPSASRLPAAQTTPARVQLGQLRGRVIDVGRGVPIGGAIVAISGGQNVVTGRDGSFAVNTLAPGSYQLVVRKPGFADRRSEFRIKSGEVTTVTFSLMSVVRRPN